MLAKRITKLEPLNFLFLIFFSASIYHPYQCTFRNKIIDLNVSDPGNWLDKVDASSGESLSGTSSANKESLMTDPDGKRKSGLSDQNVGEEGECSSPGYTSLEKQIPPNKRQRCENHKTLKDTFDPLGKAPLQERPFIGPENLQLEDLLEATYAFIHPLTHLKWLKQSVENVTNQSELDSLFDKLADMYRSDAKILQNLIEFAQTLHDEMLHLNFYVLRAFGAISTSFQEKEEQKALSRFFCREFSSHELLKVILAPGIGRQIESNKNKMLLAGPPKAPGEIATWEIKGGFASWKAFEVNEREMLRTRIIAKVLSFYYEKKNDKKWLKLFDDEYGFISFLTKLSQSHKQKNFAQWINAFTPKVKKIPLLPWEDKLKEDPEVIKSMKEQLCLRNYSVHLEGIQGLIEKTVQKTNQFTISKFTNKDLTKKILNNSGESRRKSYCAIDEWASNLPFLLPQILSAQELPKDPRSVVKPYIPDFFYKMILPLATWKVRQDELVLPNFTNLPLDIFELKIITEEILRKVNKANQLIRKLHDCMINLNLRLLLILGQGASTNTLSAELTTLSKYFYTNFFSSGRILKALIHSDVDSEPETNFEGSIVEKLIQNYLQVSLMPMSQVIFKEPDYSLEARVDREELSRVEIATHVLISHYMNVDPLKWEMLFGEETNFLLFLYKAKQKKKNLSGWKDAITRSLAGHAIIPWKGHFGLHPSNLKHLKMLLFRPLLLVSRHYKQGIRCIPTSTATNTCDACQQAHKNAHLLCDPSDHAVRGVPAQDALVRTPFLSMIMKAFPRGNGLCGPKLADGNTSGQLARFHLVSIFPPPPRPPSNGHFTPQPEQSDYPADEGWQCELTFPPFVEPFQHNEPPTPVPSQATDSQPPSHENDLTCEPEPEPSPLLPPSSAHPATAPSFIILDNTPVRTPPPPPSHSPLLHPVASEIPTAPSNNEALQELTDLKPALIIP
ncbi:hypothetical protein O181_024127 [Austropuccinia psidii MF-1]|uniref:Uncharacterized protein n=1 Tax=Austropuccinia psidii MF-1 TaxID=1389203 RepID=A0A9Q3CKW4_9BASI|nr:hypothetical protein [Austropuccinia psidii MF-1]